MLGRKIESAFSRKQPLGLITDGSMEDLKRFYGQRCDSRVRAQMREARNYLVNGFRYVKECDKQHALNSLRGADQHFRSAEAQAEQCAVQKKGMKHAAWNAMWTAYMTQANELSKRILAPCRKSRKV
jgi:hypothetical protein